jgi:hypothetical protein
MTNERTGLVIEERLQDLKAHYQQLHADAGRVIEHTLAPENPRQLSALHSFAADLAAWTEALESRPELPIYRAAVLEYQYSLFAVASGLYRQAFMSLRLFLELFCFAIECSANELRLHKWIRGELDVSWSSIVEENTGVFSKDFTRAFFRELEEMSPQYLAIAKKVYRECSQFVHANYITLHALETLHYEQDVYQKWLDDADAAKLVVSYLLCTRYLAGMNDAQKKSLEMVITDTVGYIPIIRATLGGPTEE